LKRGEGRNSQEFASLKGRPYRESDIIQHSPSHRTGRKKSRKKKAKKKKKEHSQMKLMWASQNAVKIKRTAGKKSPVLKEPEKTIQKKKY